MKTSIQWRDIPGYEGRYEINTNGTIRRLRPTPLYLTRTPTPTGYRVGLAGQFHYVQRLLLVTFCPIDNPDQYLAKARYGNPLDTRLSSWEWQAAPTGNARLKKEDVQAVRHALLSDATISYAEMAMRYGVAKSTIGSIMRGHSWKDVK